MVLEIAQIEVKPGTELEFEEAVRMARPLFVNAAGCLGIELNRTIERPQVYRLFIQWKTLEHHTIDFRQSDAYTEWRNLVSRFFAAPPVVEHQQVVAID
ncbi:antibiotic biosynthesis monooxygenase family protein [Silvibacterium dinghuense]|uniref:Antibiotic biosynthesis monooxygenase n=1 Tax=Silvibacterium dinghuense TaxID=1560006 RepID=A0A4V1NUT5_9BACT|nr:antibiotic biosynthesis monooxygenase [Silvibacterium dinghuense]RXS93358.1 antibiotic biosynthesis monooxygenase [Silvibacterium dinghuense]GGH05172.1 antibiotic biosynthesis monooxygenase [Silvibacterium dinghuense]